MPIMPENKKLIIVGLIIISVITLIGVGVDKITSNDAMLIIIPVITGFFTLLKTED